jgi:NAD-dependent dihydropyrimidine dehydrogenase PreA subunit
MNDRNETQNDKQSQGHEKPANVQKDRGLLRVDQNECKGCGLCVEACPPKVILMGEQLNHYGYRTASYAGAGCTGCGICFMVCPEPGAITVMRAIKTGAVQAEAVRGGNMQAGSVARAS